MKIDFMSNFLLASLQNHYTIHNAARNIDGVRKEFDFKSEEIHNPFLI